MTTTRSQVDEHGQEMPASQMESTRARLPTPWQVFVLLAASFFSPLRIWATNLTEVGIPSGLLAWALLVLFAAIVLWVLAVAVGGQPDGVTGALFWFFIAAGSVGIMADNVAGGRLTLFLAALVVSLLAYRLRDVVAFQVLTSAAAAAAVILPGALLVSSFFDPGEVNVADPEVVAISEIEEPADIIITVFDGHASLSTLEDFYGFQSSDSQAAYADTDLVVHEMDTNYTLTLFSLASFFDMDYPIIDSVRTTESDREKLLETIKGDNQLTEILRAHGYRTVLVESGWSAIRCGQFTDVCIPGVWPDEATSEAIRRSLVPNSTTLLKNSFTAGSLSSIEWLRNDLESYVRNDRPELIFVHVMIPHPPLLLDSDCGYRWDPDLTGPTVGYDWISDSVLGLRKEAYVAQVQCSQRVIDDVASIVGNRAIFLAFSDHGPDSRGQLSKQPTEWDAADIDERFSGLFVTNARWCGFDETESLVNVGRRLLSCLTHDEIPEAPSRHFILISPHGPPFEVDRSILAGS